MPKISTILSSIIAILFFISVAPNLVKTIKTNYEQASKSKTKVARIYIKDAIQESQSYQKQLEKFFKDDSIKAILLEIDCPGGTVGHSQAIFMEIQALKKLYNKPIISVVENLCASGAYYIACSTDYIIAPPGAIIGSIGSYISTFKYKDLMDYLKVRHKVKQSGRFKTILSPYGDDETPEQEALIQHISDDVYHQFVHDVAECRGILAKKHHEWADGKIFTARDALRLGLINKTGYLSEAQTKLKSLAKIEGDIEWVKPQRPSVFQKILGVENEAKSFIHSGLEHAWSFFQAKASGIEANF
ncbi:MAG TPA: signal peptide peptidase SppA [Candidatus Babeliales bacterium]|nr:signal peptide peptidase SppA [Candidatus Babeliales bacterium]